MAKAYSSTDMQNSEENAAQKTNGSAIPKAALALFVALVIAFGIVFLVLRNRQAPSSDPDAVQHAPLASPAARDSGG